MSNQKISLQAAILMNINIMAGAGIFINIVDLTKQLQLWAGLLYLLVGCFMFPLIFTFAQLVQMHPSGGFYIFGKQINPFFGFISCWSYFFGKLASVALYLYVITTFLQALIPGLFSHVHPMVISFSILALYMYLNCLNMRVGVIIQKCFATAKTIPMLLLILLGIYHFDINIFTLYPLTSPYFNFILMLPSVLYCFTGFEAACSVSRNIQDATKNAPKAIFYSFFSVIFIYIAFQTFISIMLIDKISSFTSLTAYAQAYPYLMTLVPTTAWLQAKLATAISFLIAFSAMGAAYGILFSNSWNLYTLAQHNHTFAPKKLLTMNQHGIPYYNVLVQGLICVLFLLVTRGNKIPLQQISTLGGTITYTLCTIAFLYSTTQSRILGYLSLLTCSGLITACIMSVIRYDITSLYLFIAMFVLGICMYNISAKKQTHQA